MAPVVETCASTGASTAFQAAPAVAATRPRSGPTTKQLPAEPDRLIGVVSLKYSPKNPANSILICEEWSGLRTAQGESRGVKLG